MLPLLGFLPVYGATAYDTVPLPVPELLERMVIQLAAVDALQLHVALVVCEKLAAEIPEGEKVAELGDRA